ncbi:28442_t:CDS:2 [Gigaspora margarita]|uniref:28442_t:CDS:1 n=1 Tax=Gigaspora margarita TaxID=4874 RepID=A0ABN7V8B5_GIGMA|nr:28442_t:CDS:2 [Gigaspora margarita]
MPRINNLGKRNRSPELSPELSPLNDSFGDSSGDNLEDSSGDELDREIQRLDADILINKSFILYRCTPLYKFELSNLLQYAKEIKKFIEGQVTGILPFDRKVTDVVISRINVPKWNDLPNSPSVSRQTELTYSIPNISEIKNITLRISFEDTKRLYKSIIQKDAERKYSH